MSPDNVENGGSTKAENKSKKASWEVDSANSALEEALKTRDKEKIDEARAALEGAQDGRMDRQDDFISPEMKAQIKGDGKSAEAGEGGAENNDAVTIKSLFEAVDKYKGSAEVKEAVTKIQEKRLQGQLDASDTDLSLVMEFLATAKESDRKAETSEAAIQAEDKAVSNSFEMYVSEGNSPKDKENLQYLVNYLEGNLGQSEISKDRIEAAKISLNDLIHSARFSKPGGMDGNPLESAYDAAKESIAVHGQTFYEKINEKMAREEAASAGGESLAVDVDSLVAELDRWKTEAETAKAEADKAVEIAFSEATAENAERNLADAYKRIAELEAAVARLEARTSGQTTPENFNPGETPQKLEGQSEQTTLDKIHEFLESNKEKEDIQELYKKLYSIGYNREEVVDSNIENYLSENSDIPMEELERKLLEAGYTQGEIDRIKNKQDEEGTPDGEPTPPPIDGAAEAENQSTDPFEAPLPGGEEDEDGEEPPTPGPEPTPGVEPEPGTEVVDPTQAEINAIEALGLDEMPGYQEVIDAKNAYLKALLTRQRWIRRSGEEELQALRENYLDKFTEFVQKNIGDIASSELRGLTGDERAAKISEVAQKLSMALVQEVNELSATEGELSNERTGNRIINTIRRHPFLRMAISGALLGGSIAAGTNPALFWAAPGILATRAAVNGVSGAVAAEGAIDGIGGWFSRRPGGLRRNIPSETVEDLSAPEINERFAAVQARMARRGETIDSRTARRDVELYQKLVAEMQRDLEAKITEQLDRGEAGDSVRAKELMRETYQETLQAIESGHDKERCASMKRWAAAGTIGAVLGGSTWIMGQQALPGKPPVETGPKPIVETGEKPPIPTEEPIAPLVEKPEPFHISEVASGGDSEWSMTGDALDNYMARNGIHLSGGERNIAIDYIKDEMNRHNPAEHNWMFPGQKISFTEGGWKGPWGEGKRGLLDAIKYAQTHPRG